jgi:cell division septation protein DedD
MLKYGALLFNTIALLIYQFFFAEGVTITQKIPSSAKPDTEFTVELTINKGATTGFAKLQQDLPEGFTAVQEENNGASFTFSNQSVKFIWMSLPNDKEFKIKYKVKIAAGISGDKTIGGKFSYVTDNVKQSIDIAPSTINIESSSVASNTTPPDNTTKSPENVTPPTTTENNTTGTNTTPPVVTPANEPSAVVCTRKVPENASGSFTVELVINKGNVSGFAKLLETLPAGFSATQGESQGASFSFNDGKVKFVWVSMPAVPEFKITYKVAGPSSIPANSAIEGVFSYIENDETKKFVIPASNISGGAALVTNTETPANTNKSPENTNTNTTPDNTAANTSNTAANTSNTTSDNNTNTTANNKTTESTNTASTSNANKTNTDNTNNSLSATNIPAPQGSVNYKVQIAALRNAVEADKLATRFNINQKIEQEMAGGLTKYLVGSHPEYKSARDARETIKSKGVNDAFVTAYNSGKRITVQEALMITSQKWYR